MIITKTFTFDSAHCLEWHQGKCHNLHGHTYKLEVMIEGEQNDDGVLMDYSDLKELVNDVVIEKFDHKNINEFMDNPTAENMARYIYTDLVWPIRERKLELSAIVLWETPNSKCIYEKKDFANDKEKGYPETNEEISII